MANFYVSAEAECGQCGGRAPGAVICLTTEEQVLDSIPSGVRSSVSVESVPHGWENSVWRGGEVRCVMCVTKEREEQAAREATALREAAKRKARRDKKKATASSG